jgi:hypothetical protein
VGRRNGDRAGSRGGRHWAAAAAAVPDLIKEVTVGAPGDGGRVTAVDGGTIRGGMETLVPARYQAPGLPS